MPYLPLPAQTTQVFLPPLSWPELPVDAADDPAIVDRCYREVEIAMQAEMTRLYRGRRFLRGRN